MKNLTIIFLLLVFTSIGYGQCSNPYYTWTKGTVITMENYDRKDRLESSQTMRVIDWEETPAGYTATIGYTLFDDSGSEISSGQYEMSCDDGVILIDMSAFIPQESMEAFKEMEVEMTMDDVAYPPSLTVGDRLPDASFTMETKGMPMTMKMTMNKTSRSVDGKETITTPAGTFECLKITETMESKIMMANTSFNTITYLAEDYGAVRTETYRSNGKLMGYTVMTQFE